MEKHFMVDIETTGVERGKDKILQVAAVEIELRDGYWHRTGREFESTLHYPGKPQNEFAKKHMSALYEKCNAIDPLMNESRVAEEFKNFIHNQDGLERPKYFMGWNASNFDMPFLFDYNILGPSYYEADPKTGKEELLGDAHYRVYEQTGSLQVLCDITGLDRKTLMVLAEDLNPTGIKLPKGKEHDALYDCYKQIIMQNGLIRIGRMGIRK